MNVHKTIQAIDDLIQLRVRRATDPPRWATDVQPTRTDVELAVAKDNLLKALLAKE